MIKFVSDLWQVRGYLWVLQFTPPIKLTARNIVENGVKHHEPTIDDIINVTNVYPLIILVCRINQVTNGRGGKNITDNPGKSSRYTDKSREQLTKKHMWYLFCRLKIKQINGIFRPHLLLF